MSKNSVTKKLITTLALLTCLCGIGTLSVHAAPKAVSFNNNSKKITMFATQRKQLKVKLSGKYMPRLKVLQKRLNARLKFLKM